VHGLHSGDARARAILVQRASVRSAPIRACTSASISTGPEEHDPP